MPNCMAVRLLGLRLEGGMCSGYGGRVIALARRDRT